MPMPSKVAGSTSRQCRVILGNCLDVIPDLGKFNFIFADPPFNLDKDYIGFKDSVPRGEYVAFTNNWIKLCVEALASNGVIALYGNDDLAMLYLHLTGGSVNLKRIAWVNWHYRFGQCGRGNWIDARTHCLVFAKDKNYTWNPDDVLVASDRATIYKDKRINDTERGGSRLPGTVWGIPSDGPCWCRVQGTSKERRPGHPNQLPEVFLERLIRAYTSMGDRILDPFGGSGTTVVVSQALHRRCVTCDISSSNVASIKTRLKKGAVRVN